ncbi:MAG: hypothetical protein JWO41_6 [Candidatus Saccharibacteria bacterium]|nr:hypothetical protein [Candidatus Saccharibacteria bacterium]
MFEKLVALLPFNPGLAHDLAFYGRRMREESSIRRTGLLFIVLTFMVQFFAVISPPQPTVADSTNDLINGGVSSAAVAAQHCKDNTAAEHYGDIMENYGISCQDIANAGTVSIKSTDDSNNLFSFGRLPQGATNTRTGKPTGETAVNIPGMSTAIYARHLSSFDSGAFSTYQALKVTTNRAHKTYYILLNCGNLVSSGVPVPYTPPTPPAPVTGTLSCASNTDHITLSFSYANAPNGAIIHKDGATLYTFAEHTRSGRIDGGTATPGKTYTYNLQAGGKILAGTTITCVTKKTTVPTCALDATLPAGDARCKVCETDSTILISDSACKPCAAAVSSANAEACIQRSKAATNTTRGYSDANNTTAQAGDVINYTLYAKNTGKATVKGFTFQENMSDVLDYADVTDAHGGTLGSDGTMTWPAADIKPGATASVQVTVKVKAVIPQTPTSSSDQTRFDLNMANVYGNAVNIQLPGGTTKTIETTVATLPNTGPGASMVIAGSIFLAAGYFYSRSRLLAKETDIELQETTAGGV